MMGQGSGLTTYRSAICSVDKCCRIAFDDEEVCSQCREEIDLLETMARAKKEPPGDLEYVARVRKHAERVGNIAWFVLFLALMSAIGYYIWPWVLALFELWFGGGE
jgi:hypothetical protein